MTEHQGRGGDVAELDVRTGGQVQGVLLPGLELSREPEDPLGMQGRSGVGGRGTETHDDEHRHGDDTATNTAGEQ